VHHLDAAQDHSRGCHRLEPEHRSDPAFNGAMILLNAVIQVGTLSNANGLQFSSQPILKGCVAKLERGREDGQGSAIGSGSEHLELLGKRWHGIPGVLRLLLAHHVDHFNAAKDHLNTGNRLKPEHRPHSPFDGAMVLLNPIVEVGALPDANGLQITSRSFLEPVYGIAGQDRFAIGLTAVDDDPLGPAVPLERLAQEPLGSVEIT
jgi:hypothetical protein